MPRRVSLEPIQAAAPTTGSTKSSSASCCMDGARRLHNGGMAMTGR